MLIMQNMIGYYEDYNKRRFPIMCKQMENIGCPLHFHMEMELSYVLTESHTAIINGEVYTLTKDDMYFCNTMEPHQFSSDNKGQHILLTIKPNEFNMVFKYMSSVRIRNFLNDKEFNKSILPLLKDLLQEQANLNELEKAGYINLIIGKITGHYEVSHISNKNRNNFIDILSYIEENYSKPITRDSLCKHFGYTPNYFSFLFKKIFHCGLIEYVNNIRYQHCIIEFAQNPKKDKYQIILDNGFNNIQSYYRVKKIQDQNYSKLKTYHDI